MEPRVFDDLRAALRELLPQLAGDVRFTHQWGGRSAIARDWAASVGLDRRTGLGWAGGYVGDGVSTTNLAGARWPTWSPGPTPTCRRCPGSATAAGRWEPEPLRWLGINAGLRAMTLADAEEHRTGRESRIARLMAPLTGGH